eukprot:PITA_28089
MALSSQVVVGVIGNITSLALYLSPMATFWGIYKQKSTQEYSGYPYVFTLFNCALGLLYGSPFVKPHSTMILTINGAGFLLETFYVMSFLTFASRKKKVITVRLSCGLVMAFVLEAAITIFVLHTYRLRQAVVGSVGVILSIVMYASPLSVLKVVIRTKSVECMPFLLSLFNFINALAWVAYAIVTWDLFIGVPSGIGCVLGMVQLTVYFIYRKSRLIVSPASTNELSQIKQIDMNEVDVTVQKQIDLNAVDLTVQKEIDINAVAVTVRKIEAEKSTFAIVISVDPIIAELL